MVAEHLNQSKASGESRHIAAGRGVWGNPDFPKAGWQCVAIVDLLDQPIKCDACKSSVIRFAHVLLHPDVAGRYRVGCVCAGYLIGDLGMARAGDATARSLAARRARWTSRQWTLTRSGGWSLLHDGDLITVIDQGSGFTATCRSPSGAVKELQSSHESLDAAQLAAFDAWVARDRLSQGLIDPQAEAPLERHTSPPAIDRLIARIRAWIERIASVLKGAS